jgi:hypothetical protein
LKEIKKLLPAIGDRAFLPQKECPYRGLSRVGTMHTLCHVKTARFRERFQVGMKIDQCAAGEEAGGAFTYSTTSASTVTLGTENKMR